MVRWIAMPALVVLLAAGPLLTTGCDDNEMAVGTGTARESRRGYGFSGPESDYSVRDPQGNSDVSGSTP